MCIGCMIGEKFRKTAGAKLKEWAMTKPDAIWIDDDMRLHNHRTGLRDFLEGKVSAEGVDYGCFCDNHIALFNEQNNLCVTKEEIVSAMVKHSDSLLASRYRAFLNSTLSDTAKWIEETVHSVSPDTRVAIMTSNPDVHSIEGRNWKDFLSSLSGDRTPLIRPTFGPYREICPLDFAESYRIVRHLDENISYDFDDKYDMCPEIENTRFTVYSKSLAATFYHFAGRKKGLL